MRYPTISRENARYRGPIESHKFNHISESVEKDIHYLMKQITRIAKETKTTFETLYDNKCVETEQLYYMQLTTDFLKGGDSRV